MQRDSGTTTVAFIIYYYNHIYNCDIGGTEKKNRPVELSVSTKPSLYLWIYFLTCLARLHKTWLTWNELRKAVWKYLRRLPGDWSARTLDLSTLPKPTHRELLVCVWTSQSICLLSPVVYSHNYCKKHIIVKRKVVFFFLRTMKFTHLHISHTWLISIILFQIEITVTI